MLNLISPVDNEQMIENEEYMQSYCLTWWTGISNTGLCLPWLSWGFFKCTSRDPLYINRHLVYSKSRWPPFSSLSSTRCKRSEEKQQWGFLLPAQDALDYVCISTTDFNFLYTELRLDSLKGHSLCNRVWFVLLFVLLKQHLSGEAKLFSLLLPPLFLGCFWKVFHYLLSSKVIFLIVIISTCEVFELGVFFILELQWCLLHKELATSGIDPALNNSSFDRALKLSCYLSVSFPRFWR